MPNVISRLSNPPDFSGIFPTITQIPNSGIIQIPIVESYTIVLCAHARKPHKKGAEGTQ